MTSTERLATIPAVLDLATAISVLTSEAACLDERRWDDWLDLYAEDAVYWLPSWADYETPTSDPSRELSLIYYTSRKRLEERVWRLGSGLSPASVPLARTLHSVSNVRIEPGNEARVLSNVVVHVFQPRNKSTTVNFGRCRHDLRLTGAGWKIASKKVLLLNDYLPASIDVYTI